MYLTAEVIVKEKQISKFKQKIPAGHARHLDRVYPTRVTQGFDFARSRSLTPLARDPQFESLTLFRRGE